MQHQKKRHRRPTRTCAELARMAELNQARDEALKEIS